MRIFTLNIRQISNENIEHIKTQYPLRYEKAKKYQQNDDFLRSIGAYLLLEEAFGIFSENDIKIKENGKPHLLKEKEFNYSHSGEYVVLVVDKTKVGVDIQIIGDQDDNYIKNWTRREALLKLTGEGISLHDEIDIEKDLVFYKNNIIKLDSKKFVDNYFLTIATLTK